MILRTAFFAGFAFFVWGGNIAALTVCPMLFGIDKAHIVSVGKNFIDAVAYSAFVR